MYAEPVLVEDVASCKFYHVMELPGLGLVGEDDVGWDLRASIDSYLGHAEFDGRRVLDVGSASGYLTFEMERRGAEVVSLDLPNPDDWDLVPFLDPRYDTSAARARYRALVKGRINAYWLAHRLLNSRARAYYGDIYHLPRSLGPFDTAMLGMVLGHLRDPFGALHSIVSLVEDSVIITEPAPRIDGAYAYFMPDPGVFRVDNAWWATSEECRRRMMAVLGFEQIGLERQEHRSQSLRTSQLCSTQVFRRVYPNR